MFRRLLRRVLYGGSSRFREHERQCLGVFLRHVPAATAEVISTQLGLIETIQRFSRDKLVTVNFGADDVPLILNTRPELRVARVEFSDSSEVSLSCTIVFHEGKLSSLEFSRPPGQLVFPLSFKDVKVQACVFDEVGGMPSAQASASQLKALSRLQSIIRLVDVMPPAPVGERETFLAELPVAVPADLSQVLEESNGFVAGHWRFLGTHARTIVLSRRTYLVLAERDDSQAALCLTQDDQNVVYYDQIDDEARPMASSFVDAFAAAMEQEP